MTRLCVLGPSGRMGQHVMRMAHEHATLQLSAVADAPGSALIGSLAGSVPVTDDLSAAMRVADVYIDFTVPAATARAARAAMASRTAAVIGTTGLDKDARAAIDALAEVAPVLVAANFSLGVNLLLHLAETAARALGEGFDLEIVELHHRNKRDAPSGTALALGQALARGRELDFPAALRSSREGDVGARSDDEIGIVAVRGGDIVGEHTAYLIGTDERIELTHRADKRQIFAGGALRAAAWLAGRPPGHYTMAQVLGLT